MTFSRLLRGLRSRLLGDSPTIELEQKRVLLQKMQKALRASTFVETGTFRGDTLEFLKRDFKTMYSIELSFELAQKARDRFATDEKITIVQGDSATELRRIVSLLSGPALFWLDGHYSSEFFLDGVYYVTAKGEKETPIRAELNALLTTEEEHVIVIDDARLFVGTADYPTFGEVKSLVSRKSRIPRAVFMKKDMIIVVPKQWKRVVSKCCDVRG